MFPPGSSLDLAADKSSQDTFHKTPFIGAKNPPFAAEPRSAMGEALQRDPEQSAAPPSAFHARSQVAARPQNRMLGLMLGSLVLLVFITVVALALIYHYAEVHHATANL